jgi:hypothetical protein
MPEACYVWLVHNPIFKDIPSGYVIHHLDGNPINNDPSNLVLMQKHHHLAHHLKNKIIHPKIKLVDGAYDDDAVFAPISEPTIRTKYRKNGYMVVFMEMHGGKKKKRRIGQLNGESFKTKEQADNFKQLIWDHINI